MLIEKDKSALIVVDVQEKLVSAMPKPHKFIDNIIKLQKAASILKVPVIFSEQYPKGLGKTISKMREKNNFSNIEKTDFAIPINSLSKITKVSEQIIICGIEAHVCVLQTAINLAVNKEKLIYIVQDGVSSRYQKDYLLALNRLDKYSNIHLVSCEMVLFEWLRSSNHPNFKTISQLIK